MRILTDGAVGNRVFHGNLGAQRARFLGILGAGRRHSGGTYSYMFLYLFPVVVDGLPVEMWKTQEQTAPPPAGEKSNATDRTFRWPAFAAIAPRQS